MGYEALIEMMSSHLENNPSNQRWARERLSLNRGWLFHQGDIPFPVIKGHRETYQSAKAGQASGAAAPDYDDTEWRQVGLPHDWVVEGEFDQAANLAQGYRHRGFAWYRRHFALGPEDRGRYLELQFDGIATHATIWVNGTLVHRNFCGYTSCYLDITALAKFGDALNVIAVRVDAEQQEGWWYEGGGLYRSVWLEKRTATHIQTDGVFANPVRANDGSWSVPIGVALANCGESPAQLEVDNVVLDPEGGVVGRNALAVLVGVLGQGKVSGVIPVTTPRLWSVTTPTLYQVVTTVRDQGVVVDEVTFAVGFRTLRFDANRGFFLNDQPLKIQGTCNHQDHAGVGVAVPAALWEFRLRKLKAMGANAYRCAHHPPAREFLDAADRLGMLVMDENRLFNPSPEYLRQLEWMVRRDRNHPCVFLWSVFNEEPMQGTEQGYEMVRRMTALVKSLDATRPVTAAMNGGLFAAKNVSQVVDVVGFNYQIESYDRFHAANPALPLLSSEDTSALMQRGEFTTDPSRHLVDSYDTQAPAWGATHRAAWQAIDQRKFIAGGFVWTGFDYRGEPTPYQWPSAGSFTGCMDQCGFPKTAFFIRRAQWVRDQAVLHLVPHWNWPGREGRPIKVMIVGNVQTVELTLNGESLGERILDPSEMLAWDVAYAPGKLEAIGKTAGIEVVRTAVETTGVPVTLRLTAERMVMAGDACDAVPVTVEAVDAEGRTVPTADLMVEFAVADAGAIIGLGNGDPNSHEPEKGNRRSLYQGLAQVILQSAVGEGTLIMSATAPGVAASTVSIEIRATAPLACVPVPERTLLLEGWMQSPITAVRPDPQEHIDDQDQNSWSKVITGNLCLLSGGSWVRFRSIFHPFVAQRRNGGTVHFRSIIGRAEVWLNGQLVATKADGADAPLVIFIPSNSGPYSLTLLVEGEVGQAVGLNGPVRLGSPL